MNYLCKQQTDKQMNVDQEAVTVHPHLTNQTLGFVSKVEFMWLIHIKMSVVLIPYYIIATVRSIPEIQTIQV